MDALRWDYRIIRHEEPDGNAWFSICEVFYDREGRMYSFEEVHVMAGDPEDLSQEVEWMSEAFEKPIVDAAAIPEPGAINEFTALGEEADAMGGPDDSKPGKPMEPRDVDDILDELEEW